MIASGVGMAVAVAGVVVTIAFREWFMLALSVFVLMQGYAGYQSAKIMRRIEQRGDVVESRQGQWFGGAPGVKRVNSERVDEPEAAMPWQDHDPADKR